MKSGSKENLTWKINYLAAQVGEKTHMKTAIFAASRAKHQQIHNSNIQYTDKEALKVKLQNARKQKLEHKLHQSRREIKSALKKAKSIETQKQIKKIKSAKVSIENKDDDDKEKEEKKVKKQDLEKLEKELDMLKHVDLEYLTEKKIKSNLKKNGSLKNEEPVKELIENIEIKSPYADDVDKVLLSNIEARLLSHKAVINETQSIIESFISILKGDTEKIEKKKTEIQEKKRKAEEAKKKEEEKKKKQKTTKGTDSSKFMESLAADDEKNDENFKNIYEGVKKPNRVGQRQRRKQWEELYGKEANHVVAAYQKREEKRLANPDYKPKKVHKPTPSNTAPAEPMHPSWEAKRQQQEMMSKALSGKVTSNNKIVFNDDD
ncbi:hypothetical protein G6F60_002438 [Rhizopus arrhizus]|nr:hypothetical protein G6F60_002438 [Rhizopus arrhizus]